MSTAHVLLLLAVACAALGAVVAWLADGEPVTALLLAALAFYFAAQLPAFHR